MRRRARGAPRRLPRGPAIRGDVRAGELAVVGVTLFFAFYVPALGLLLGMLATHDRHHADRPAARAMLVLATLVAVLAAAGGLLGR